MKLVSKAFHASVKPILPRFSPSRTYAPKPAASTSRRLSARLTPSRSASLRRNASAWPPPGISRGGSIGLSGTVMLTFAASSVCSSDSRRFSSAAARHAFSSNACSRVVLPCMPDPPNFGRSCKFGEYYKLGDRKRAIGCCLYGATPPY